MDGQTPPETARRRATVNSGDNGTRGGRIGRISAAQFSARLERTWDFHRTRVARLIKRAASNPSLATIMKYLALRETAVYDDLVETTGKSRTWVKLCVGELRDMGFVTTKGNPALIEPATDDMMLLLKRVVARLFPSFVSSFESDDSPTTTPTTTPTTDDNTASQPPSSRSFPPPSLARQALRKGGYLG